MLNEDDEFKNLKFLLTYVYQIQWKNQKTIDE